MEDLTHAVRLFEGLGRACTQLLLDRLDEVATFVVDGGVRPAANHMTIVNSFTTEAKLIRTGLVHQRAVNAALGREIDAH